MSYWGEFEMFCTMCGNKYLWSVGYSWKESRTCCKKCHRDWKWLEVLSIMNKPYTPRKLEEDELPTGVS